MRPWQKYMYFKLLKLDKLFASLGWYPPYPIYEQFGPWDRPSYTEGPIEWNDELKRLNEAIREAAGAVYPKDIPVENMATREVEFTNAIDPRQIIGLPGFPLFRASCNSLLKGKMRMVSTGVSVRMFLPDFDNRAERLKNVMAGKDRSLRRKP